MLNKDKLIEIASYILQGLSEEEACILCDVPYEVLQERKEQSEDVRNFIKKQSINFKLNHLKEIQTKKNGNNSQWLLEKIIPEQFGSSKRDSGINTVNIISQIVNNIQDGETTSKITPRTRADYIIDGEKSNSESEEPRLTIGSVLK